MTDAAKNSRWRAILLLGLPLVLIVVTLVIYLRGGRFVETDNAYLKADVVPISAEISGRIDQVLVRANQAVAAGEVLFRIDSEPFELAVARARARMEQVRTELAALQASHEEKQAQIALARADHAFARRELRRQEDLKGRNFVSESTLDDLRHGADQARQQLTVLELDLRRIAASLGGDADAPLEQHPAFLAARADLQQALLDLERVEVRAPVAGVISEAPLHGQYVRAGNMITALVANGAVWVEANFTETDLTHVRPGQQVKVTIDSYPALEWRGVVDSISPATGAEFAIIPAQNATGNWVKVAQRVPVRVRLQNDDRDSAPVLRAGLSAVVEIDTEHRRQVLGMSFQSGRP